MRLPASSLTIGEDSSIVTLDDILYELEGSLLIYQSLGRGFTKDIVECKGLEVVLFVGLLDRDLVGGLVWHSNGQALPILLLGVHRPHSNDDFDCLAHMEVSM